MKSELQKIISETDSALTKIIQNLAKAKELIPDDQTNAQLELVLKKQSEVKKQILKEKTNLLERLCRLALLVGIYQIRHQEFDCFRITSWNLSPDKPLEMDIQSRYSHHPRWRNLESMIHGWKERFPFTELYDTLLKAIEEELRKRVELMQNDAGLIQEKKLEARKLVEQFQAMIK